MSKNGVSDFQSRTADLQKLFIISSDRSRTNQAVFLLILCFFSFFVHLDAADVDLMEARNFVTARETALNGTWLIPTMNGEVRINKPPLPTWITAAVRIGCGDSDNLTIMRLPAASVATLMVFSVWGFLQTISKDRLFALLSASILATFPIVIDQARRGTWDIYCHGFMMAGIWAFSCGCKKKENAYGLFALAGIALGCSFMSKGPVSFYALLLPMCFGYAAHTDRVKNVKGKWKGILLAVAICLSVSSIWPAWLYYSHPSFFDVAKNEVAAWTGRHVQPFYFYLQFPIQAGLWSALIIAGFVRSYAKEKIEASINYRFIITWAAAAFVFLSIIPEKKEKYLLPAMIPMAIMAGSLLLSFFRSKDKASWSRGDNILFSIQRGTLIVPLFFVPAMLYLYGLKTGIISMVLFICVSAIFLFFIGSIFMFEQKRSFISLFLNCIILICLFNLTLLPMFYQTPLYRNNKELRSLAGVRKIEKIKDLDFYTIDKINPQSVWDLGKSVRRWDYRNGCLPTENEPFIVFSNFDPQEKLQSHLPESVELNLIDTFKYDPKNPRRVKYLTLVNKKNNPESPHKSDFAQTTDRFKRPHGYFLK